MMFRAILPLLALSGALLGAPADQDPQPAQQQRKQVTVPVKTLNRYVGTFTMQGVIIRITRENSHLFIQKNDEPRTELFAESDLQFYTKSSPDLFTFEGITGGKAIIMKIHQGEQVMPLYRVE